MHIINYLVLYRVILYTLLIITNRIVRIKK